MSEVHKEKFAGVWCPAEVLISELNANELRLWLRIRSFQGKEDCECFASNDYLAKDLKVTPNWVSVVISQLVDKGFLSRRIEDSDKRYLRAIFTLRKTVRGVTENCKGGYGKLKGGVTENCNIEYKEENTKIETPPTPKGEREYEAPETTTPTSKAVKIGSRYAYPKDFAAFWERTWKEGSMFDAFESVKKMLKEGWTLTEISQYVDFWTNYYRVRGFPKHVAAWLNKRFFENPPDGMAAMKNPDDLPLSLQPLHEKYPSIRKSFLISNSAADSSIFKAASTFDFETTTLDDRQIRQLLEKQIYARNTN